MEQLKWHSFYVQIHKQFKYGMYRKSPTKGGLHLALVVGLVWLCDLESYAGGNLTTGRVTHAGKVKR
jgi:hypothetical protein